jgi:hypothetical protein
MRCWRKCGSACCPPPSPHIEAPCSRFPSAGQWFGSTAPQYAGSHIIESGGGDGRSAR